MTRYTRTVYHRRGRSILASCLLWDCLVDKHYYFCYGENHRKASVLVDVEVSLIVMRDKTGLCEAYV